MLLKMTGHEVHTAYDGEEAIVAAEMFKPEVVLLDIGMPKLNGYDACRRIRGQPWGKGIYLVALTGWGQEDDRRRTEEVGFNHHMVKPVEPRRTHEIAGFSPRGAGEPANQIACCQGAFLRPIGVDWLSAVQHPVADEEGEEPDRRASLRQRRQGNI